MIRSTRISEDQSAMRRCGVWVHAAAGSCAGMPANREDVRRDGVCVHAASGPDIRMPLNQEVARRDRVWARFAVGKLAAILLLFSVAGCSQPSISDRFIRVNQAEDGIFRFALDFSDSLASYDISVYTRLDASRKKLSSFGDLPLEAVLVSPGGAGFRDTVRIPLPPQDDFRFGTDAEFLLGSGLKPAEPGEWAISFRALAPLPGFRGIGLVEKSYGTR